MQPRAMLLAEQNQNLNRGFGHGKTPEDKPSMDGWGEEGGAW